MRMRRGSLVIRKAGFAVLLLLTAGFCLGPLAWQLITSLTPEEELTKIPPLLPSALTGSHYQVVLFETHLLRALVNSFIVASSTTLIALIFGSLAGFALAKLPLRGKNLVLAAVLSVSMFPPIATISPLYIVITALGLRDSLVSLVGVYCSFSLPLSIWIMTSFFRSLPDELIAAAKVDGCSTVGAFLRIALPLTAPALASAGILVFIFAFNEFLLALTFTVTESSRTVPVEIALFPGVHQIPWGEMAAASMIVTLPLALIVLLFQHRIIEGMTAGAAKG